MSEKRSILKHPSDPNEVRFIPGTPEERMAMVRELTMEMYSLDPNFDPDEKLQRHVTRLIRQKDDGAARLDSTI